MAVRSLLIGLLRVYRLVLSPAMRFLFGTAGACRFSPTCSCYAMEAIARHGALRGLRLTLARLLRCHPWGGAGYDPVPVDGSAPAGRGGQVGLVEPPGAVTANLPRIGGAGQNFD